MDAVQVISSAMQIVSSMVAAVGSIAQASRDLQDAPRRIRILEEFVSELESLTRKINQKHVHKLHNSRLDRQIQSLNKLVELLHPNITKARKIVSKNKIKNFGAVVWNSMAGDPLAKTLKSISQDLNWWLESQKLTDEVENVIEMTARSVTSQLKVAADHGGYPISSKCFSIRKMLENDRSLRVILIVGLSGIGKTCLARQVASDLPSMFVDGAVELQFGQWCSRNACNGDKSEYQKRLIRKLCKFLMQIGFQQKIKDEHLFDLEHVCFLLQEALCGKAILVVLDDVWEQDIVERFAKLHNNNCRFLVTTRNESVYEITEAEKVEVTKDDIMEISKAILVYHSLLKEDELPGVADELLERCGHHPLTVAVIGKALRKELRAEKWDQAISNISTYAACWPGPISYVNEKEAAITLTIFGSLEFSLEAMPIDSRRLFIAFASLSWAEPLPEACLEAVWTVLGHDSLFPLVVCKLVEGSLLMKYDSISLYQVHDMVSLYLDTKLNNSMELLLIEPVSEKTALISPWLFIFGRDTIKTIAEKNIESYLDPSQEKLALIVLDAIIQALSSSISRDESEASRAGLSAILGPKIADLMQSASKNIVAMTAKAIMNMFSKVDFINYLPSLETTGTINNLAGIVESCDDPAVQTGIFIVLAKLAEFGRPDTVDEVLDRISLRQLADVLSLSNEEWQDRVFTTLMSLIKAGKSKAVERMFAAEVDKSLIQLLDNSSDVVQHHALATLKSFYELGGPSLGGSLEPGMLKLLPWQARLRLEKFVVVDQNSLPSPKIQTFDVLLRKMRETNENQILEAMQELIPIIERVEEPKCKDMILKSTLFEQLSELLSCHQGQELVKSQCIFAVTKLAFGGEPCVRKIVDNGIIFELVKTMQCESTALQESAYTALHQMLFGNGGILVLDQIFRVGLVERLISISESKSAKTREVSLNCILDIAEVGNKNFLERLLSLQVVEKLLRIEKAGNGSGKTVVAFLKGISKCKHLTPAERWMMKQQVSKKARTAIKGHKFETQIIVAIETCLTEGSKGSSSNSQRRKKH